MFRSVYITRFFSGLLLLVFILGITPKRFLHNAFATHTDKRTNNTNDKPYQFSKSGYNCDCDNLVAQPTFINHLPSFYFPLFTYFSSYTFKNISFNSIFAIYSPLRGPPVNI